MKLKEVNTGDVIAVIAILALAVSLVMSCINPRSEPVYMVPAVITAVGEIGVTVEYDDGYGMKQTLKIPQLVSNHNKIKYQVGYCLEIPIREDTDQYDPADIDKIKLVKT